MRIVKNNRQAKAMQIMASRIANISLPNRTYDVFRKLRERQIMRYGNDFGMANNPNKFMMPADQYLSASIPTLPTEEELDRAHERKTFNTRAEIAQRDLGMPNFSHQLSVASTLPRAGIASATKAGPGQHAGHMHGPNGECIAGAATDKNFNPQFAVGQIGPYQIHSDPKINDAGWGVTLSQLVGSGMLSQEQLQAASYSNVLSLIQSNQGESFRREMAFYLQRFILEGYVRGYDVIREIQQGGSTLQLNGTPQGGWALGVAYGMGSNARTSVAFNYPRWNSLSDETKLTVFYHELGHELLEKPHGDGGIMSYNHFSGNWTRSSYKSLVDQLFRNAGTVRSTAGTRLTAAQADQLVKQNPNWFPSISGVDPTGIGGDPNNPGSPNITDGNTTVTTGDVNVTNQDVQITPTLVNPGAMGNPTSVGPSGGDKGTPDDVEKTPVAGTLPDMAGFQVFPAGLQDAVSRSTPMLQGLAGALGRFKSGH